MKFLVCGGRAYEKREVFRAGLAAVIAKCGQMPTHIIHGGAKGADALAHNFALDNGIQPVRCEANWLHFQRAAGPIRNRAMLDLIDPKKDMVIAFPGGNGTGDLVAQAHGRGITVVRTGEAQEKPA